MPVGGSYVYSANAPTVSINNPFPGMEIDASVTTLTVSGNCQQAYQGSANLYINGVLQESCGSCSGAGFTCASISTSSLPDGVLTLSVQNTNSSAAIADDGFYVWKDSLAPGVSITSPAQGATLGDGNFTVGGTCGAAGYDVSLSYNVMAAAGTSNSAPSVLISNTIPCSGGAWSYVANLSGAPDGNLAIDVSFAGPNGPNHTSNSAIGVVKNSAFLTPNNVLGQSSFTTATPNITSNGMNGPQAVAVGGGHLLVADKSNNRVLIWNSIPTSLDQPADAVLGQTSFTTSTSGTGSNNFNGPTGVATDGTYVAVADSGNNRVLIWNSFPTTGTAANTVLGQNSFTGSTANAMGAFSGFGAQNLSSPYGVAIVNGNLIVADTGNYRVLVFDNISGLTPYAASASVAIGQSSLLTTPTTACSQGAFSAPRGVASNGTSLVVTDYSNNLAFIYNTIPTSTAMQPNLVLGKPTGVLAMQTKGGTLALDRSVSPSKPRLMAAAGSTLRTPGITGSSIGTRCPELLASLRMA